MEVYVAVLALTLHAPALLVGLGLTVKQLLMPVLVTHVSMKDPVQTSVLTILVTVQHVSLVITVRLH